MTRLASQRWLALYLGFFLGLVGFVSAASAQRVALATNAPVMPAGVVDGGALAGSVAMQVTLYLTPDSSRQAALASYLTSLQTPGDAAYHAWLTPQQFGTQFGVNAVDLQSVTAYAKGAGLSVESVSPSGLRVVLSGTVSGVESAFAPALHRVTVGTQSYFVNTVAPSVPLALSRVVGSMGGLSTVPATVASRLGADGAAGIAVADLPGALGQAADTNTARVLAVNSAACVDSADAATEQVLRLAMQQAGAEGMTVLAAAACGAESATVPGLLGDGVSVAIAPGLTLAATTPLIDLRPSWQTAEGLPDDGMRHAPDVTVSDLGALAQAVMVILAKQPVASDGGVARLGNIGSTLYRLIAEPGLYTQPDGATSVWETQTGLGVVNLEKLEQFFPRGSLSVNVSINVSNNGNETHGQAITFTSSVTDTSGNGNGVVPTGTVNFVTGSGTTVGSVSLSAGTATASYSQLPGGSYTVQAQYSGDGTYAATNSISTSFTVAAEAAQVTAAAGTCSVGGTCNVTVTVKSTSGIGTPAGTVTVIPQGTSDNTTYSGTLSGSSGTATATVPVAAVQGGADVFKVNCTTDTTFTCYNPVNITAQVSLGTPTLVLTANPVAPTNGETDTLTAVVSGHGGVYPTPTGNIAFYDNGVQQGSGTLSSGTANLTTPTLTGNSHSFSATYGGDNNYSTVTASAGSTNSAASATTLAVTASPNVPVSGQTTTLTATLGYTTTNNAAPTGTVNFFVDGSLLGSGSLSNGVATLGTTTLGSSTTHTIYAVYNGDTNYQSSTAPTITTATSGATGTSTSLIVNPSPPVSGSTTSLVATVVATSGTGTPTGSVTFYEDNAALGAITLSGGSATYSSTTLSGTTAHTFYAVYSGSTTYATSTSPTVSTTASGTTGGTVTSTTTLTVSPNPPVSGSTTTLMATVIGSGAGVSGVYPSGTVTFLEDGTSLGTGTLVNQGSTLNPFMVATLTSTTLSGTAAHSFTAIYPGNSTYATSTSPAVATVASSTLTPATLALSLSPNPPTAGSSATLTGTITTTGTTTPTGTITLYYDDPPGGLPLGSITVTGKTVTLLTQSGSLFSGNLYNAVYSGDSNYTGSTSQNLQVTATQASTTTTVAVAATTVATGGTVALTATIAASSTVNSTSPTGTVTFSSSQGTLCSATISGTTAICTATFTTAGTQTITAAYGGDTNYLASTSTNAPTVTVGTTTTSAGTLTASATPASVMYGNTVVLSSTLTPTTAVTGGPSGTVTFALSGTTPVSYTSSLVVVGTAATATYSIPTPAPGTYTVTATCTSTNVTCTTLSATAALTVVKGSTTTTLTADPTSPQSGETTVFTATVAPSSSTVNAAATAPTGTVTFYINGVASSAIAVTNGIATYSTVLTTTTGNFVTAVYSGDTNWNGSTSNQLDVLIAPIPTTGTLTASQTTALYGANIVLKDNLLVTPSALLPNPNPPTGTVTFYDNFNGQTTLIATVSATPLIVGQSIAETTTTGLLPGTHYVSAFFNGGTTYSSSTSTIIINITDYTVTFSPTSLAINQGSAGTSVVTITPVNGFGGQVALACSPPTGVSITCSVSPASITTSGTAILTIQTTATKAEMQKPMIGRRGQVISLAALSLATLLGGFLVPRRRRLPMMLLVLIAALVAGGSQGCTTQGTINTQGIGGTGGSSTGTPLGTQLITVTTQGTDGVTVVRHNSNYPITVQ